jgi:acetyl-CoA/propionyl-CoA carboxylase carboxyl transferase subunit
MTAEAPLPRDPVVRLQALFDEGSMSLLSETGDTGAVAASGLIEGSGAVAFASDPRVQGGASGAAGCAVIVSAYEEAVARGVPIIGLWHSGGARIAEGVASLDGVGQVFAAMTTASGVVPQISVVLGPAAGGAAYGPALTDIVILSSHGRIFVTGPDVVRSVTGEDVDMARLGGPEPHSRRSGVVHLVADSDSQALGHARTLVSLLSEQGKVSVESVAARDLSGVLPESAKRAYDVHGLVSKLLDAPGLELHPKWAPNIVTILGRFAGRTVGIVANNPMRLGGCLDSASAEKAARFVRFCDAFGVPLVVLVDCPGYLPGVGQEWDGVVRRGAKLLHAFAEAVVPRVSLVTRKGIGGAYIAMNSRSLGATRVFAWPDAEVAVMGALAAVRIIHKRRLASVHAEELHETETALAAEHEATVGGLGRAVELGVVDEIISPAATATALASAIGEATPRRGAHGNIPL